MKYVAGYNYEIMSVLFYTGVLSFLDYVMFMATLKKVIIVR
jgi:hypothetical protein